MVRCTVCIAGSQLQLPQGTTSAQLQTLLNGLLSNEEPVPYAFFIDDFELTDEVGAAMLKHDVSVEQVVQITYRPQAVFRVRPVARCSATMEGIFICIKHISHNRNLAAPPNAYTATRLQY